MGRHVLLLLLIGCNVGGAVAEEGRYSFAEPPDAKPGPVEPTPDADVAMEAEADAGVDAPVSVGTCARDESRDVECAGYHADAGRQYAVACPADDAGNPTLPPPEIDCNYTGWADGGTLTMCCK